MPGAGTRTATTRSEPPARCLDITRLVSRVGRGPDTGVDRVERAYLRDLIGRDTPLYALCRTAFGHVLLDRGGLEAIDARLSGSRPWGPPDVIGRLSRRLPPARQAAEADLRRHALGRARRARLGALLRRHLPEGTAYLNVGHSDLGPEVFAAWRALPGARIAVLIHDTIPLDHPEFQRPGTPARFEGILRRTGAEADLVICNSAHTQARACHHFRRFGRVPETLVAPLGVTPSRPDPSALPASIDLSRPVFLALGTIEPRKNHALLLDVWERLRREIAPEDMPLLVIAGTRGWENEAVFRRLDALPPGADVLEVSGLGDAAIAALMERAAALLFPSRSEGFGLPPMEAAARGTPVICSNLPVFREFLGDYPVYADPDDVYFWAQSIRKTMAEQMQAGRSRAAIRRTPISLPSWNGHFNLVFRMT